MRPWFPQLMKMVMEYPIRLPRHQALLNLPGIDSSIDRKDDTLGMLYFRDRMKTLEVLARARDIKWSSWKQSTKGQYATHPKRWKLFCDKRGYDPIQTNVNVVLELIGAGVQFSEYRKVCNFPDDGFKY